MSCVDRVVALGGPHSSILDSARNPLHAFSDRTDAEVLRTIEEPGAAFESLLKIFFARLISVLQLRAGLYNTLISIGSPVCKHL